MFRLFMAFIFIFILSGGGFTVIKPFVEQFNAPCSEVLNKYQTGEAPVGEGG